MRLAESLLINAVAFITLAILVVSVKGLTLTQKTININEGGSCFQRVIDSNITISKCIVQFIHIEISENSEESSSVKVNVELDMESSNAKFPDDFKDSIDLKKRLQSLGSGYCGFKIDKVSSEDPREWTLVIVGDGETQSVEFKIGIYEPIKNVHKTEEADLGSPVKLYFWERDSDKSNMQYYCFIYNPQGQLVAHLSSQSTQSANCEYDIKNLAIEDVGDWKAITGTFPYIEPFEFTVTVKLKEKNTIEKWVKETEVYLSLGCSPKDCCGNSIPKRCIMTSPIGEKFIITPGSATKRYTTLNTHLENYTCAMEIKKPLTESEKGRWICEINDYGVFLQVGSVVAFKDETFSASTIIEIGESFQIGCKLQEPASRCFITSPTGVRHQPNGDGLRVSIGECLVDIKSAEPAHNGTWICTFFKDEDVVGIDQPFEVSVRNAIFVSSEVSTMDGGDVTMYCNTGRSPLEYCWFSSPTGTTYQLKEGARNDKVSYVGKSLEFGDCGIKLHKVFTDDIGNWSCTIKIGSTESTYTITMDLITSTVSLATGLGIGIGVTAVVVVVGGSLVLRKYRGRQPIPSESSGSSITIAMRDVSSLQTDVSDHRSDSPNNY